MSGSAVRTFKMEKESEPMLVVAGSSRSSSVRPKVHISRSCAFCHRTTDEPILYGPFKSTEKIVAHYYCVVSILNCNCKGFIITGWYAYAL